MLAITKDAEILSNAAGEGDAYHDDVVDEVVD